MLLGFLEQMLSGTNIHVAGGYILVWLNVKQQLYVHLHVNGLQVEQVTKPFIDKVA